MFQFRFIRLPVGGAGVVYGANDVDVDEILLLLEDVVVDVDLIDVVEVFEVDVDVDLIDVVEVFEVDVVDVDLIDVVEVFEVDVVDVDLIDVEVVEVRLLELDVDVDLILVDELEEMGGGAPGAAIP